MPTELSRAVAIVLFSVAILCGVSFSQIAGAECDDSWPNRTKASAFDEDIEPKLNIIFVMIDDLGKEWVGCYGGEEIETPNVDALAKSGLKFTNAYSMPQCTPSRVCLLTGQYPFRNGWVNHWDVPRWGLGFFDWKRNPCLPRVLRSAGYRTAVAGKWQINDFRVQPESLGEIGFDDYCLWTGGESDPDNPNHETITSQRYWDPYIHTKAGSRTYAGKFGPDIYNDFILDFITAHREEPFFIYYPMALTHGPLVHTPHDMDAQSKMDKHKAMVWYADHLLGTIVSRLDELKIRERTLIVWTTDNGTARSITGNRNGRIVQGGKSKTTENGVNAPFIVNCPGTVPAGKTTDALFDFTDLLPTFGEIAGATLETGHRYDGFSAKQVFFGKAQNSQRKWIMAMGGGGGAGTDRGIQNQFYFRDRVLREKRYKLFIDVHRRPEKLVDVLADRAEATNLLRNPEHRDAAIRLTKLIEQFPKRDADPVYDRETEYPQYRPVKPFSQFKKKAIPSDATGG